MEEDKEDQRVDESYKILYTTFLLVAVFVFFYLLIAVFDDADVPEVKEEEE